MGYKRRHSNIVLNLTPLIDIVFLLLVFFMLTAHFVEDEVISIDLPDATSSQVIGADEFVDIVIGANGVLLIEGQTADIAQLEAMIASALAVPGKRLVRLRGDTEASLGLAVRVIDAARAAGADAVDILTQRP